MFEDQIKLLDYYFFGIGIASLVVAFYLSLTSEGSYLIPVIFYFASFLVSFMLNIVLTKKMKTIYIWNTKHYLASHTTMAVITSAMTVAAMIFFGQSYSLVLYFIIINFCLMIAFIIILYLEYKYAKQKGFSWTTVE